MSLEVGDADPDPLGVPNLLSSGGVYGGVSLRQLFMVTRVECVLCERPRYMRGQSLNTSRSK